VQVGDTHEGSSILAASKDAARDNGEASSIRMCAISTSHVAVQVNDSLTGSAEPAGPCSAMNSANGVLLSSQRSICSEGSLDEGHARQPRIRSQRNSALRSVFLEFARFGTRTNGKTMDIFRFMKLCRECCLLAKPSDASSIDLVFYKVRAALTSGLTEET
jgi:hypothetical protein